MHDPLDIKDGPITTRVERARLRAFLTILLENITVSAWRSGIWCGAFIGLWLFQIQALFAQAGAIAVFIIFIAGLLYFARTDFVRLRRPNRQEIDRRIEQASRLKHRPLTAMTDSLSNPLKPQTRRLWEIARARTFDSLKKLRAGSPRAFMATRDPYALRLGVLLFFMLGMYSAGSSWSERILAGLTPFSFGEKISAPETLTLWITPPEYTGIAPIIVKGNSDGKKLDIPEGSLIKISIHKGIFTPRLIAAKNMNTPFKKADAGNYILETQIPPGETITVMQGLFTRASWPYHLIPDTPPQILLKGKPDFSPEATMRFPLEVKDDYGVKNLVMHMTLNQSMNPEALGEPFTDQRIIMSPPGESLPIQPVYDLAFHPWAGQPVAITFTAEDGKGQVVTTDPIRLTLPERHFMHPSAQALIAERKNLILAPTKNYESIVETLEDVLIRPGLYLDDKIVFLAIRSAASRLYWADPPTRSEGASVVSLLWDTAVRIEGGEISLAARNLRDAQNNLAKTLDNPAATPEDIQKSMENLRAAMGEYFMELQREMQKRMTNGQKFPNLPTDMLTKNLDPDALNEFLERMQAHMMEGDKNAAREMLGQLQRLMDMMDPSSLTTEMPADMQMMNEGIDALQDLIRRQRELLDQTQGILRSHDIFKNTEKNFGDNLNGNENFPKDWNMDNMPPPPTIPKESNNIALNTDTQKKSQDSIRNDLLILITKAKEVLGDIPENMGLAEQEMSGSSESLAKNDPEQSIPRQEQALAYLEQAQKDLGQKLMARMEQMTMFSLMGGGMKFDPLGRPVGGKNPGNNIFGEPVKIPDEGERKKAQELLRLIRNRSDELERPEEERDYFKRLLKQF